MVQARAVKYYIIVFTAYIRSKSPPYISVCFCICFYWHRFLRFIAELTLFKLALKFSLKQWCAAIAISDEHSAARINCITAKINR